MTLEGDYKSQRMGCHREINDNRGDYKSHQIGVLPVHRAGIKLRANVGLV